MARQKISPQTVQTVQDPEPIIGQVEDTTTASGAWIEVAQHEDGLWYWMLWSRNGKPLATSTDGVKRRNDVTTTIKTVKELIGKAAVMVNAEPAATASE